MRVQFDDIVAAFKSIDYRSLGLTIFLLTLGQEI